MEVSPYEPFIDVADCQAGRHRVLSGWEGLDSVDKLVPSEQPAHVESSLAE